MDNFIERVREMIGKLNYLDGKKETNLQILKRRIEEIRKRNTANSFQQSQYGKAGS
jgi:hypothetical protein